MLKSICLGFAIGAVAAAAITLMSNFGELLGAPDAIARVIGGALEAGVIGGSLGGIVGWLHRGGGA